MLQTLGLDTIVEDLYAAMLRHPGESVAGLARILGVPEHEIRAGLEQLSTLALVHPTQQHDTHFFALSPEAAMGLLLSRQESALAAAQRKMETSRMEAARFVQKYAALSPDADESDFERIIGVEAIRVRLAGFGASAQHEMMTFAPGGAHTVEDLAASREPNAQLLERNVQIRTVYLESVRNHQPTMDHLHWLAARGGEVRTTASLPNRMIIIDRREALIPIDTTNARAGAVLVRCQGMVTALTALFESVWEGCSPLCGKQPTDEQGLTVQEAEVIKLLAQGLTDAAIAKRLGVSPRTARRLTAELMQRLNARSRFEAGARAVQRGWLVLAD